MSRNRRATNRTPTPAAQVHEEKALAEVVRVRVADLGPQHIGCRVEVSDRYDGMIGPAAGTLVGYRPATTPPNYRDGGAPWRTLLLAQGPGRGEPATVREVDHIRIAL